MSTLKFASLQSEVEVPFYTALASLKINHDKLDVSARKVLGVYELRPSADPPTSCRMQVRGNALTSDESVLFLPKSRVLLSNGVPEARMEHIEGKDLSRM